MPQLKTARGRCLPLGAMAGGEGVNFAVLCRHGTAVTLVLMAADGEGVIDEIGLDPHRNRTGDHWHVMVYGLPSIFRYGWRVDGPPGRGQRFNPHLILLDPSATAIADGSVWGGASRSFHEGRTPARGSTRRSLFIRRPYDWKEDAPLLIPLEDSIIYELHVRGFTCHPSAGASKPGTFLGLTEKIPYLKGLGVTAVELLPVHEFDEDD
ncbi:MAG: glycogen debranching enzyme, partial [Gemmataceae bacterium]